jgi:hypothetical protein
VSQPISPAGYFITFTTYGERLHGDDRSSVERLRSADAGARELAPDRGREGSERQLLLSPAVTLDREQREAVADAAREVCSHNNWHPHAINVRTNHVHIVVSGPATPERTRRKRTSLYVVGSGEDVAR